MNLSSIYGVENFVDIQVIGSYYRCQFCPSLRLGPGNGAGHAGERIARITTCDVDERDEDGGEILMSSSPAKRALFPAAVTMTGTARLWVHWTVGRHSFRAVAAASATLLPDAAEKLPLRRR